MLWFYPTGSLASHSLSLIPPSQWGEERTGGKKKKLELAGWDKTLLPRKRERKNSNDNSIGIYIYKKVMYSAVAHHPQKDAQPVPEQWLPPSTNSCQFYSFHTMSYGTEYPFDQFRSAILVLTPQILSPVTGRTVHTCPCAALFGNISVLLFFT